MKDLLIILLLGTLLALTGCTSKAKKECALSDWRLIGKSEGQRGQQQRANYHYQKCLKYGFTISSESYEQGYEEGIAQLCGSSRGFSQALKGLSPESICRDHESYLNGYDEGLVQVCTKKKGESDALNGKETNQFCSRNETYSEGYSKGLSGFCSRKNGYHLGSAGSQKTSLCDNTDFIPDFLDGYASGRAKYLQNENFRLESQIKNFQETLDNLKVDLKKKEDEFGNLPTPEDSYLKQVKAELDTSIKSIKTKKDRIEQKILNSEEELIKNRQELDYSLK